MSGERVLPGWANWQPCQATPKGTPGCIGRQLDPDQPCFVHTDKDDRAVMLGQLREGGSLDFMQGVVFTEELLAEVLEATRTKNGRSVIRDADFRAARFQGADFRTATFQGGVEFDGASFGGDARFDGASFERDALFRGARFEGNAVFAGARIQLGAGFAGASFQRDASFHGASIRHDANFDEASFGGDAGFDEVSLEGRIQFRRVRFEGSAWFRTATFAGRIGFDGASFEDDVGFRWASFEGDARFTRTSIRGDAGFDEASFAGNARFDGAKFAGRAGFDGASFQGDAKFVEASFQQPLDLGPVVVAGTLSLERIVFTEPVQLEATAGGLSCRRTRFQAGGQLRIADAEITLEDAEVPAPLVVARHAPSQELLGQGAVIPAAQVARRRVPELRRPLVVSVQRADVAKLTLTDLDLRGCRFTDAHHLDQLTINSADAFHRAPARVGHGRQVLAEECTWRRQRPRRTARRWPVIAPTSLGDQPVLTDPRELIGVYRQLRKGREDAKNEPGAADFYYGECEMRRHAPDTPWAEKAILTVYWLLSGYGLRAARALLALVTVLIITVGLLMLYGLPQAPQPPPAGTLHGRIAGGQTVTVQLQVPDISSVPISRIADRWSWPRLEKATRTALNAVVFRSAEQQLTTPGRYIEMLARFLGPVLLALTILAVRNRVKR
jgi:uncharacterized protein YjbI with pentapeptide repeats